MRIHVAAIPPHTHLLTYLPFRNPDCVWQRSIQQ